jgi:hypothetical protein
MAPAIAHFLVGASLVLLFAAPFVLRYGIDQTWVIWLVAVGGIWGLLPDIHHIVPVYSEELFALHESSPWVDLFALHYTLDRPLIREMYNESVLASVLLFLIAITVFQLAAHVRDREFVAETTLERGFATVLAHGIAAAYAGFVVGVVFRITSRLEQVAALIGQDSLVIGGVLVVAFSLLGGAIFAVGLERIGPSRTVTSPLSGGLAGLSMALVSWIVGITLLIPVWMRTVFGIEVAIPYIHWASFAGIAVYGIAFGMIYATVRGALTPRDDSARRLWSGRTIHQ